MTVMLRKRRVAVPAWSRPITPVEAYATFRLAFFHRPQVRIFTRAGGAGEPLTVGLEQDDALQLVEIPAEVLAIGARTVLRRAAHEAAGAFASELRCATKVRYASRHLADGALVQTLQRSLRDGALRRETHAYACPHCSGWHLTSQLPSPWKP